METRPRKILSIDLTKKEYEVKSFEDLNSYIGGVGLGFSIGAVSLPGKPGAPWVVVYRCTNCDEDEVSPCDSEEEAKQKCKCRFWEFRDCPNENWTGILEPIYYKKNKPKE